MIKKVASVLTASRNRHESLLNSLRSLGWPNPEFEVLVAIDDDEPQMADYKKTKDITLLISERYGYNQLHRYYNAMAKLAKGDWFLNRNDDSALQNGGWLGLLKKADASKPLTAQYGSYSPFPLMTKVLYDLIGHFSVEPLVDRFLLGLGYEAGIHINLGDGVDFTHGLPDDPTKEDKEKAYGMLIGSWPYSPDNPDGVQATLKRDKALVSKWYAEH